MYTAGIYTQCGHSRPGLCGCAEGWEQIQWSAHRTAAAAARAARKYARGCIERAGGSAWWSDGERIEEVRR